MNKIKPIIQSQGRLMGVTEAGMVQHTLCSGGAAGVRKEGKSSEKDKLGAHEGLES